MVQHLKTAKWTEILSVSTSVSSLLVFLFVFGVWKGRVDAHAENNDVHMTSIAKFNTFVPRTEIKKDVKTLHDLEDKVDNLSEKFDRKFDELHEIIRDLN